MDLKSTNIVLYITFITNKSIHQGGNKSHLVVNVILWILFCIESWLPPIYLASENRFRSYSVITTRKSTSASGVLHWQNITWLIIVPFTYAFLCESLGVGEGVVEILRFGKDNITFLIAVKPVQILWDPPLILPVPSGLGYVNLSQLSFYLSVFFVRFRCHEHQICYV